MTTTFNPSDNVNMSLTGGNLVVVPSNGGGVRTILAATSGKYYFEIAFSAVGSNRALGVANSSATLSTVASTGTNAAQANNGGTIAVNGSVVGSPLGAFAAGGACCIALDVPNRLIWFRNGAGGNWNGSGSAAPASGTGGLSISALGSVGTPLYAMYCATSGGPANGTANFGDTAFVGTVPTGFNAYFPTPPATTSQAYVMMLA
jgi:hypothetical protein